MRSASAPLVAALDDHDVTVVEAAAWSLGELDLAASGARTWSTRWRASRPTIATRSAREAAVAALGALGDERGLPAILHATDDKPAVRRRAVLALAPFDGDDVDAALRRALDDRDWQVRQAAEDLTARADSVNARAPDNEPASLRRNMSAGATQVRRRAT